VPRCGALAGLRPADSALQSFDEELAQEMLDSNVASELLSRLEVRKAYAPLPSVPAGPPEFRVTLEGGAVAIGYFIVRDEH
jgi:hypothetical protein